ncbi:hybrid sensor histidine kinase/response regulator, partial [Candidatus Entotheonella palauensis]|uniref:hybrid sensor histidine kinase/response regulator n=1 Tax=Candidatus Entotheonella palauensis TaxID=93172 RepID=UPI000B7D2316
MDDNAKTREQVLAELTAHRALVEGTLWGIAVIDEQGHCLFANPAFAVMCGAATPEDIIGQQMLVYIAPEELSRLAAYGEARLSGGTAPSRYEFQGRQLDGTPVWVEALVSMIEWEGKPTRLFTCIDITERRQTEDEVKHLQAQLLQTQKMEAIGTFASGIAHEFNNILNVVMAYIGLAESEIPFENPAQSYLAEVDSALQRAKDLLNQMSTFSRQTTAAYAPVDFAALVQDALRFFRVSLTKTIDIREHISEEPLMVLADSSQLHQILMNLFANAEYVMRRTGGCLEVWLERAEVAETQAAVKADIPAGAYVCLKVRDTGPGMTTEVQERIFEPFYTTKAVGEGTGMGLAIVHSIVTNHGGIITVDSHLDEGTTFAIYLPGYVEAAPESSDVAAEPPGRLGCVLLVDDEPALTRGLASALTRLGYQVVFHVDPESALAAFEAQPHHFDVLLTDQAMPGMTGVQLADRVRQIRPDIPVILCSAYSHTIDDIQDQETGFDALCRAIREIDNVRQGLWLS